MDADNGDPLPLIMYRRQEQPAAKIMPSGRWRDWMNETDNRNANRCLPLLMANQAGWVLLNPAPFTATWDGGNAKSDLTIEYPDSTSDAARIVESHFGHGIITFGFRDVICTPPGYNLCVRGPTNSPKDGICALDGLVETDWSAAPFTMNWKLTRPGSVAFEQDEPFCYIFPQRRGELERFRPEIRGLDDEPDLEKRISAWGATRAMIMFGRVLSREQGDERHARYWLENYFRGKSPTGESSPEHQTKLRLSPFADNDASSDDEPA